LNTQQQTSDDGFHEIQLNGKQLVFLFMAGTVVAVVIFLCGVLVGRGVKTEKGPQAGEIAGLGATEGVEPAGAAVAQEPASQVPPTSVTDPAAAPAPPPADELTYFNRLEKQAPPVENLKAAPERPAPAPEKPASTSSAPQVASPAPSAVPAAASKLPAEPAGAGFAVQVAAVRGRGEAEAIVKRLAGRGYAAYVLSPASGSPSVFRVRVGKFKTHKEAEVVAGRLQKEEQFKPWITR